MAFEDVNILVRKDAGATEVRWRQDAAIGSLITFSLSDTRDVRTFEWKIIGRPEGSGAGGGGPEPITLTTAQTCSITLDVSGAYIVSCTINGGSPNQTFKTAGVSILCTITDPVGRPLRYLGGYETDEDLADPLVAQGWIKMLDRWLHALESYIERGGVDTFKVALDNADVLAATYDFLPDKLISPNSSIDIDPRVEAAIPKVGLDVAKDARAPLGPTPGGYPGDGPKAAMWDHQHPPEGARASTLYTGVIREATLLDPVVAFVKAADGSTGISSGATSLFDLLPDGVTFRRKSNGQLYGMDTTGGETIVLEVGDRVAFFWEHPTTNRKYNWTCKVTTLGTGSTKAVITKTSDSLVHGSTFKVDGAGAQFENWYWQLDTADPIQDPPLDLVWIYVPSYVNTTTYPLLTGAQLVLSSPGTHETSVTIPGGSSGGVNFAIPIYTTLTGTPGVAKIPKGVVTWEVLAYLVTDNPTARTYIRAFLSTAGGVDHNFAFGDSKPIHATEPTVFTFQATIPNDIDCDPTDLLNALFYGFSDSPTDITIKLVYNEPKHRTRVTVPMEFPLQGYDTYKVKLTDANDPNPDFVDKKVIEGDYISMEVVEVGGVRKLQIGCTLSPVTPDDHQVGVSAADIAAAKWGPLANKTRGDNVTIEAHVETDPMLGEQVVFSTISQADPIAFASTLYAAHLDDPAWFGSVKCVFGTQGCGQALFSGGWTQLRSGVWQFGIGMDLSGTTWFDSVTVAPGDLVFAWCPALAEVDWPRTGIYVVRTPGNDSTGEKAILERVDWADSAQDFANGMVVYTLDGSELLKNKYFRLTTTGPVVLETTPLYWEKLDSYEQTASDNLLTAAQLARASETPNTTALVASVGSPSSPLDFPTLAGAPNLDTYKAGRTEAWALARLHIAGSDGSVTWLEIEVVRDPGGDDEVLETITTSPITNATDEIIKAHVDDPDDQDLAGDSIGLRIRAYSDSATPAAIAVTWSDPAHSTRLLTPMSLAVGGTDDHQALTATSRGFTADGADARAYRHPMDAIQPGRILTPSNATVTSAAGLFAVPLNSNFVVLDGSEDLIGCSTAGWAGHDWIEVHILSERNILKSQSPLPDGYAPFMWGSVDTGYGADYDIQTAYAGSIFRFRYTGGVWRIAGIMNM